MAGIFISWGTPDSTNVKTLRDRLKDTGLPVFEYSEDMPTGAQIHTQVLETVNRVKVALVCFSDATADRQWLSDEVAWCYQQRQYPTGELKHILPVWVGPHPENKIPHLLSNTAVRDLSTGDAGELEKLIVNLFECLGSEAPVILPAALFAMNKQQCTNLFGQNPPNGKLTDLCTAVGMSAQTQANLLNLLLPRYENRAEDFSPFRPNQPLLAYIQEIVRKANEWRRKQQRRPIYLRWMHNELVANAPNRQETRNRWSAGSSLLIVDSVSTFENTIRGQILDLPEPSDPSRQALLWIPPYTQHTADLETFLLTAAQVVGRLGDALSTWTDRPQRLIAFDATTSLALDIWLRRAFFDVPDELSPLESNINAISSPTSGIRPKAFWQTSGS